MPSPRASLALASALLAASASCTGSGEGTGSTGGTAPPPSPDAWVDPTPAIDKNPDPDIVEIDLEARTATKTYLDGKSTTVWSYDGTVPGPVIEAKAGDKLIVHFKNSLPMETTIHWHGIRVPNAMDGALAVQKPVPEGGSFTYEFQLPDAGLFWFHPHVMTDIQTQRGLYGVIRVRGPNEPTADAEKIVVLDDVLLNKDGSFTDPIDDDTAMLGREGNVLLVNGKTMPALEMQAGAAERLRLVNVANGRFFNLSLAGTKLRVIGTDGGLVPHPYDTDKLLIAPGERYDVMLIPQGEPGDDLVVVNEPYERGHSTGKAAPMDLIKVHLAPGSALTGRTLPEAFPAIERLAGGPADTTIVFDESYVGGVLKFTVDGKMYPDVPPLDFAQGSTHILDLQNDAEMDHPFHLHGFFFQVLSRGGVPVPDDALADKDTLILLQKTTTRVVARFDRPGAWMYHCHILEHAERGMMGEIHVAP
jgi:FtsP/CotA-like multicopper oxidase with cupredoxin domain